MLSTFSSVRMVAASMLSLLDKVAPSSAYPKSPFLVIEFVHGLGVERMRGAGEPCAGPYLRGSMSVVVSPYPALATLLAVKDSTHLERERWCC